MFCEKCGEELKEKEPCPKCGAGAPASNLSESRGGERVLTENVAGLLCYVLGWITGMVFIFIDKRPYVRFHAIQSMLVFGGISIVTFVYNKIIGLLPYGLWSVFRGANTLISLGSLLLGIFLIVKAYGGKRFKLPLAGDAAEKLADGSSPLP